jgi:hypothetical protein
MLLQLFHQILNPIYKVHQLVSGNIKFRSRCSSNSSCCSSFVIFTIENRALHNINQESCLIQISAVRIRILCRENSKTSIKSFRAIKNIWSIIWGSGSGEIAAVTSFKSISKRVNLKLNLVLRPVDVDPPSCF